MLRRMDDFFKAYENLTEGTSKIFGVLTDKSLDQAIAPGHRTLGQIAWHIVTTYPEMMNRTAIGLSSVSHTAPPPRSAAEIASGYKAVTGELMQSLRKSWTDGTLETVDEMYGEKWPRGATLSALLAHEVHHRGQMMVLLRQAGVAVPGVFGPSKEEWAQYGMQAPPY